MRSARNAGRIRLTAGKVWIGCAGWRIPAQHASAAGARGAVRRVRAGDPAAVDGVPHAPAAATGRRSGGRAGL